jgi:hypothetical protein
VERIETPLAIGNLRVPTTHAPPLILLIPGLDSTKEEFFRLEELFLARGMATLSMDGPGQGETGYTVPIRHDYEVGVSAALDALAGRDDLDLDRVGALGVSLGGYYAPRAGAFEPRLKAVAGISGAYDFGEIWDSLPPLTRETFTVKSGARDEAEARALAGRLSLAGVAERLDRPALFITGKLDRLIPWEQTERGAREAPGGTFVLFEERQPRLREHPVQGAPAGRGLAAGAARVTPFVGRALPRREDERLVRRRGPVPRRHRPARPGVRGVRAQPLRARAGDRDSAAPPLPPPPPSTPDRCRSSRWRVQSSPTLRTRCSPRTWSATPARRWPPVVADSPALAADLLEQVEVDYAPLAPTTNPTHSGEWLMRWRGGGGVEEAFAAAAHVVRTSHVIPRLVAAPIEPRGAIASFTDHLTLWTSSQDPHRPRAGLAHVLDLPPESIEVIVPDVGGAFGSKGPLSPEAAVVAVLARQLGRPVKWVEDRSENFLSAYQGRGMQAEVELALDADGRMLALRARILADLGAYLMPATGIPPRTMATLITGCYAIEHADVEVFGARTNKVPTGPYRGAGRPEARSCWSARWTRRPGSSAWIRWSCGGAT